MSKSLAILMVAAENDGLHRGKVGGIGDVVRDVPPALAEENCEVTTITPSYGFLHKTNKSTLKDSITFSFAGEKHTAQIFEVEAKRPHANVTNFVIDHPHLESYDEKRGQHLIYWNDPVQRPFATDATKYAFFCTAVAQTIKGDLFGQLDCIHLHDWHAAFLLILREFHQDYKELRKVRTVYTIHNLALQGTRPVQGESSSLLEWYPWLDSAAVKLLTQRYNTTECINPMAVGIRFADVIHTVSPSYAEEITKPSENNKYRRYYGGEGLDSLLLEAKEGGRLFGILNGCEYPEDAIAPELEFTELLNVLRSNVFRWAGTEDNLSASHFIAHTRLTELGRLPKKTDVILTSVTRAVGQKVRLWREITKSSEAAGKPKSALQSILEGIKDQGVYILLGTGEKEYEDFLTQMSSRHENFIFLCGYSDECSSALYQNGDLFIMPSLYEPCGISQMIAMRAGQPCVVHNVGGLRDTVADGKNGFVFEGADLNLEEQAENFVRSCIDAVNLKQAEPHKFRKISENARKARFLWKESVKEYIEKLYGQPMEDR